MWNRCDHFSGGETGDSIKDWPSTPLEYYVDELFEKRGSKREDALASIIQIFSCSMKAKFLEKNFLTLLHRFLNSMKKGSVQERDLASNALGLLAMTIHCRDRSRVIFNESTPLLAKGLSSSSISKVLESLAVVTFFCAENADEVEKIMQIIWEKIHQGSADTERKINLISAWSFLLSTLDGWRLSSKYWKGAISYFSSLLEDEVLCAVAFEALSLIHEIGSLDRFSGDLVTSKNEAIQDSIISPENNLSANVLNEEIDKLVTDGVSASKLDLSKNFQPQVIAGKYVKIGKLKVYLSAFAQMVQLNFIVKFLGREGFNFHMRENELVQNVFEFRLGNEPDPGSELYVSEKEKLVHHYFEPAPPRESEKDDVLPFLPNKAKSILQRQTMSSNSSRSKAKTQLMNKKRVHSQERRLGHFVSGD